MVSSSYYPCTASIHDRLGRKAKHLQYDCTTMIIPIASGENKLNGYHHGQHKPQSPLAH